MTATRASLGAQVREAIRLLTELQDVDDELRHIAAERGDLPEEVNKLREKIRQLETYVTERQSEIEDTERELAKQGDLLADAKTRHAKYQQQLYSVKTSREYDAITHEFNFVKAEMARSETTITDRTQRKLEFERLVEQRKGELERIRTEEQGKAGELADRLAETEQEERQLLHRRENIVVRLQKPLYAHYERIRVAKDGRGVARILDGACGGCFAMIPHQTQANIRQQTDIVLCEMCGRIIVP